MKDDIPVQYRIVPSSPGGHLLRVSCLVTDPDAEGQVFMLPNWIPGSYLVRDFARHIVSFQAHCARREVGWTKSDKSTWACAPCDGPLEIEYEIYANDLSVRGAHFDVTHAFFNGTSVFLRALGKENAACLVDIEAPADPGFAHWRVATAMPCESADDNGFGRYRTADYDELIDHPVEIGDFSLGEFTAAGVPHAVAITGHHYTDMDRLCADLAQLCEYHIDFFGRPAPMDSYLFLVTALGEGYGGLEHRASSSLMCRRDELPLPGKKGVDKGYRRFLGLCSHEYFHSWNVKRIKPAAFTPYRLEAESYTELLWVFEGITSYFDDLALVRSGLITGQSYLELLGQTMTKVRQGRGRLKQSLAESSFDAWTRFYKQDENAPNAIVSYYTKGALAALALDLVIRQETDHESSLEDVVRAAWQRFGQTGKGMPEDGFEALAEEVTGLELAAFFDRAIRSTGDLPLESLLPAAGVDVHWRAASSPEDEGGKPAKGSDQEPVALGATLKKVNQKILVKNVLEGGAACQAGVAAGDELVALDGVRVTATNVAKMLEPFDPEERVPLQVFRRDQLMTFELELKPAPRNVCYLTVAKDEEADIGFLEQWLDWDDRAERVDRDPAAS